MIKLSASRISTAKKCSWTYWCKYVQKLPDTTNEGASRGTVCHLILELLCEERHKATYDLILSEKSVWASPPVKRLIYYHTRKLDIHSKENLKLINNFILNGLNYDYFGTALGAPSDSFSEKKFDISVNENSKNYRINGLIDKLFIYSKKKLVLIRDFKASKAIYKGADVSDNLQDLIYCLAVKHLYPENSNRKFEFVFLKFDLEDDLLGNPGEGVLRMKELSASELEGFEYELTGIQEYLDHFSYDDATANLAAKKGFPTDGSFSGRLACGFASEPGQLKKDGTPMWHCPFKFAFDYWALKNKEGEVIKTSYLDEKPMLEELLKDGYFIEQMRYDGCPAWQTNVVDEFTL